MAGELEHRWRPIEPPSDANALEAAELRHFEKFWVEQRRRLEATGAYGLFWDRVVRRWSIETGVLERVYDVSPGATEVLVEQGFVADLLHHGDTDIDRERLIAILEDHRGGLGMVMDLIGGRRELTVGWIKELHVLLCRHQPSVTAREIGPRGAIIEIPFEHGVYKRLPNNPTLPDGRVHEYCPPEHVASEMERLVAIHASLPVALPEVRSAWLHHGFTAIHPFQDGNGRVARALASIDFIRARLFPLLVDRTQRNVRYIPALEAADGGNLVPLVEFFAESQKARVFEVMSMAEDAIRTAGSQRAILQAAKAKVADREQAAAAERRVMRERLDGLVEVAMDALKRAATDIRAALPKVHTRTRRSNESTGFYWRQQIVQIASVQRYWADLQEPRIWAQLELEDGGVTDLIVFLCFVGNPSPGACMGGAFLLHRDTPKSPLIEAEVTYLPQPPSLFLTQEPVPAQHQRFERWLGETVVLALAEWKRRL